MDRSYSKNGRRKDSKKKVLNGNFHTPRPVGRPRNRWADVVQRDALQLLGMRGWRWRAENGDEWRRFMREAKARKGLKRRIWMEYVIFQMALILRKAKFHLNIYWHSFEFVFTEVSCSSWRRVQLSPTDVVMKYHSSENGRFITVTSCNFSTSIYFLLSRIKFSSLFPVLVNEPNSSEIMKVKVGWLFTKLKR